MSIAVIIGIVIGIVAVPAGKVSPQALAQFERLQQHVGREVVVVDGGGLVMEGRLLAVRDAEIDLGFGTRVQPLIAADIARVDRQTDSWVDGLVKGLAVGALFGALSKDARWTANSMAIYGSLGLLLDYRHVAREPIYRARDTRAVQIAATLRW